MLLKRLEFPLNTGCVEPSIGLQGMLLKRLESSYKFLLQKKHLFQMISICVCVDDFGTGRASHAFENT